MKYTKLKLAGLVAGTVLAASANATVINQPSNSSEPSLQQILNNITVSNNSGCTSTASTFSPTTPGQCTSSVNVQNDQVANHGYWSFQSSSGAFASFVVELTSNAGTQSFGLFDPNNVNNRVNIFNGAATNGNKAIITLGPTGNVLVSYCDLNGICTGSQNSGVNLADNRFGFFYTPSSTSGTYYSVDSLNANGTDRMVAFQGKGDTVVLPPNTTSKYAGQWGTGEYMLGWEDGTDFDYQDMVVQVESVSPVPEPGTLALLGLGLVGFGLARRRKAA